MCYHDVKILDTVVKSTQLNEKYEIRLKINLIVIHIHILPENSEAVHLKGRIKYFDITFSNIDRSYLPFIEMFRL